jgi:hypothetical protein
LRILIVSLFVNDLIVEVVRWTLIQLQGLGGQVNKDFRAKRKGKTGMSAKRIRPPGVEQLAVVDDVIARSKAFRERRWTDKRRTTASGLARTKANKVRCGAVACTGFGAARGW